MDEDIKALWLAALRSGDYEYTSRRLVSHDGRRHDANGVLCELAVEAGILERVDDPLPAYRPATLGLNDYNPEAYFVPEAALIWAGISPDLESTVAELNDNGASFDAIAAYIEKNA